MPQILIMENVFDVIGSNNIKHFARWVGKLEKLGYTSKWQCLNGKNYGVPQNRDRCFMVSWLGDYYYDFPQPIKLEKRLKDVLETNVDGKYYLSEGMVQYFTEHTKECKEKGNGFKFEPTDGNVIGKAITTKAGERMNDNFIKCDCGGGNLEPKIVEPNRFYGQAIQTAKTNDCNVGDTIDAFNGKVNNSGVSPTVTTRPEGFKTAIIVVDEPMALDEQNDYIQQDGCVGTLTTDGSSPKHNNRIIEPIGVDKK